jgi:hypothetical protein
MLDEMDERIDKMCRAEDRDAARVRPATQPVKSVGRSSTRCSQFQLKWINDAEIQVLIEELATLKKSAF